MLSVFVLIGMSCGITGCDRINPCQQKEIYRDANPDKIVDVVISQKDCGATTSISSLIFIVPRGASVENYTPILTADHVKGLQVEWIEQKQLMIRYSKARIFNFTNFWHSKNVDNFKYQIAIREEFVPIEGGRVK